MKRITGGHALNDPSSCDNLKGSYGAEMLASALQRSLPRVAGSLSLGKEFPSALRELWLRFHSLTSLESAKHFVHHKLALTLYIRLYFLFYFKW